MLDGRLLGRSRADSPLVATFDAPGVQRLLALDAQGRYAHASVRVLP